MPGLLPWALVPSPSLCFSPQASRDTFCAFADLLQWMRLSSMAMAGQTHLLGECLVRATPKCLGWAGRGPSAVPLGRAVPLCIAALLQPGCSSCILLPCPRVRSPQGLFSRRPRPIWALAVVCRGLSTPSPLCLWLSLVISPTGLLAGRRESLGGSGGAGRRDWSGWLRRVCTSPVPLRSLR